MVQMNTWIFQFLIAGSPKQFLASQFTLHLQVICQLILPLLNFYIHYLLSNMFVYLSKFLMLLLLCCSSSCQLLDLAESWAVAPVGHQGQPMSSSQSLFAAGPASAKRSWPSPARRAVTWRSWERSARGKQWRDEVTEVRPGIAGACRTVAVPSTFPIGLWPRSRVTGGPL